MEYSVNDMNVDANRTCGKCLSQIRREQGITQVELAKKLGGTSVVHLKGRDRGTQP